MLAFLAGFVALLVIVGTVGALWITRRSFPQTTGTITVPGLQHSVEVVRDSYGVPQVYADTPDDLFYAQGYVQAQDRFWEMDFRRHITAGRLAELFGKDQVETDTVIRTMGWRRVAEQELPLLSASTRAALDAYTRGVNAYLATHSKSETSLEYVVLGLQNRGYTIEPWSPVDSLAWLKAMAWDLRGNMEDEIARSITAARVGVARTEQLYPGYPFDRHQLIVTQGAVVNGVFEQNAAVTEPVPAAARPAFTAALERVQAAIRSLPTLLGSGGGIGSNSWVVAGSRTTTGKPILANDPHLAPMMPSIWYQMGLHCRVVSTSCRYDVAGYTFSGMPGVIIGHNDRIAWGFTNLGPDVSDLYLEQLQGDQYLVDGKLRPLSVRTEQVKVAGGSPVTITIRTTNNGPLVSDASTAIADAGQVAPGARGRTGVGVALRWTALDPGRTADAILVLDSARSWSDFRAAAQLFEVPAQNLVYADVDGNIGYQSPGKIPVRGAGDGRWPAPGWDSRYDWTGYIPFAALPSIENPSDGYLVTANNAVIDTRTYPYLLTDDWSYGARSQRIVDLLTSAKRPLDVAAMTRIQADTRSEMAAFLTPKLLQVTGLSALAAKAQAGLRGWDYTSPETSTQAGYYNAVWKQLLDRLFDDEVPADARADGEDRWFEVVRTLWDRPNDPWWDDVRTPQRETRDDTVRAAMDAAAAELGARLGTDPSRWQWGSLHTLELTNQSFGTSGIGPVEWLFNRGPLRTGGGSSIVDATGWTPYDGYQVDWVPSMRMVVDLADLDRSRWVNLTGASGHAFNPHYSDQAELWRTGRTTPFPFSRTAVEAAKVDVLVLQPSS